MTVTREVEEDGLSSAFGFAAKGFISRNANRVSRFRSRHDSLGPRERHASLETRILMNGLRLDETELSEMAHQRRHPVVAKATCVESGRDEPRTKRVHFHKRCETRCVSEIVSVAPACQRGARSRFDGDDANRFPFPNEPPSKPGKELS